MILCIAGLDEEFGYLDCIKLFLYLYLNDYRIIGLHQ